MSSLAAAALGSLGSLASGGLQAAGGVVSSLINANSVKQTNAANAALAEKQNEWNIDMWNRNNEYNTPSAQLQRIRDAGMNPSMVFGDGGTVVASQAPQSANLATQVPYQINNPDFSTLAQIGIERDKLVNEKQRTKNDTDRVNLEAVRNNLLTKEFDLALRKADDQHLIDQQTYKNLITQNEKMGMESLQIQETLETMDLDQKARAIDLAYQEVFKQGQLQEIADRHNVSLATVQKLAVDTCNAYKEGKLLDQSYEIGGEEFKIKQSQAGIIAVDVDIHQENKEWNKWTGRISDGLGIAGDILGLFGSGLKSALTIKGKKRTTHTD